MRVKMWLKEDIDRATATPERMLPEQPKARRPNRKARRAMLRAHLRALKKKQRKS